MRDTYRASCPRYRDALALHYPEPPCALCLQATAAYVLSALVPRKPGNLTRFKAANCSYLPCVRVMPRRIVLHGNNKFRSEELNWRGACVVNPCGCRQLARTFELLERARGSPP